MKRLTIILLITNLCSHIYSQSIDQRNVPAVVVNSFHLRFPNADNVKWERQKGDYRVEYKVNSKAHKLTLDARGDLIWHSQDLFVSEIPDIVLSTIGSKVTYFDVHDAYRVEEDGTIMYEISFKTDGKNHLFRVSEKGKLMKYRKELKDSEVPESIVDLIQSIYGPYDLHSAKYVEEPGKTIYMLRGEINDSDHSFTFDENNTILEHSQDLRNSEIPAPVLESVKESYSEYEIRDADLIEENGDGVYVLRLRRSRENIYVTFSSGGNTLHVKK